MYVAVLMDDGREFKVATDQRDHARACAPRIPEDPDDLPGAGLPTPIGREQKFMRASAWAACLRTGDLVDVDWPEFNARCAFAVPLGDDDIARMPPLGPTTAVPES
jgi:hypothetical protein